MLPYCPIILQKKYKNVFVTSLKGNTPKELLKISKNIRYNPVHGIGGKNLQPEEVEQLLGTIEPNVFPEVFEVIPTRENKDEGM